MASKPPFVDFYVPDEGYGTILQCPTCTETLLHHTKVEVETRDAEDEGGTRATIHGQNVAAEQADHFAYRRDNVYMTFECETCDWQKQTFDEQEAHVPMTKRPWRLCIRQHKGSTVLTWEPTPQ